MDDKPWGWSEYEEAIHVLRAIVMEADLSDGYSIRKFILDHFDAEQLGIQMGPHGDFILNNGD